MSSGAKAALVFIVLGVAAAVWWFFIRTKPAAVVNPQYVTPAGAPPVASSKDAGLTSKLEGLSTAGCQVSAKYAGVGALGSVCKYTPFNIVLKAAGPVSAAARTGAVAVASATKTVATDVVGAPVAGAKAAAHFIGSLF